MGEANLFEIFLEEEVDNVQQVLLMDGVDGLMRSFEFWLGDRKLLDETKVKKFRKNH